VGFGSEINHLESTTPGKLSAYHRLRNSGQSLTVIRFGSEINHTGSTTPVPEFIDPVFAKTSTKRSFSTIENECFGLFLQKLGLYIWAREKYWLTTDQETPNAHCQ
jgi:hypothetical protein